MNWKVFGICLASLMGVVMFILGAMAAFEFHWAYSFVSFAGLVLISLMVGMLAA